MSIYLFAECKVDFVGSVHRFDRRYILRWSSCEDTLIVTSMGLCKLTIVSVMFIHRLPWRVRLNIPFCGRSVSVRRYGVTWSCALLLSVRFG